MWDYFHLRIDTHFVLRVLRQDFDLSVAVTNNESRFVDLWTKMELCWVTHAKLQPEINSLLFIMRQLTNRVSASKTNETILWCSSSVLLYFTLNARLCLTVQTIVSAQPQVMYWRCTNTSCQHIHNLLWALLALNKRTEFTNKSKFVLKNQVWKENAVTGEKSLFSDTNWEQFM